jgi:hypothetical protein
MALQIGGQISLSNITAEMGQINSNVSLGGLSTHSTLNDQSPSKPNESQPHAMSEFFAYDHSYSSLKSLSGGTQRAIWMGKWFSFCGDDITTFYFHDGNKELPVVGNTIYTNFKGNMTPVGDAHIKIVPEFSLEGSAASVVTTSAGKVTAINSCEGLSEGPNDPGLDPGGPSEPDEPGRR